MLRVATLVQLQSLLFGGKKTICVESKGLMNDQGKDLIQSAVAEKKAQYIKSVNKNNITSSMCQYKDMNGKYIFKYFFILAARMLEPTEI